LFAGIATFGDERAACLVIERRPGSPPATTDGWRRMGRAYARLSAFGHPTGTLTTLDPIMFGRRHAQRVSDLGDRLAPVAASIPDWERLVAPEVPGSPPLVITHGDPGPGNFLDDGDGGTIIDWEEAHIAPRGLDLARLVFIALLGAGPSGYVAREHRARASAALDGYLGAQRDCWQPSREESRWWTTVAGIQFVHRRWKRRGRPASWEDAADVLRRALTEDLVWSGG
jgi:aminoglycoside phosphotransferase (APT) family kinase protein